MVKYDNEEEQYEYWLACLTGIGNQKKRYLRERFGGAQALYYIEETKLAAERLFDDKELKELQRSRRNWRIAENYKRLCEEEIRFVPYYCGEYPQRLRVLPAMPYALFVKGKLPEEDRPAAAIVGARRCSAYGEQAALSFAGELAKYGITVVSGMARGIDGTAHRGALNAGGLTYAVLGCGADICYPRENKGLYKDILKTGGVLSEYPPGTQPLPMHFPARNRIISGLSDMVLVMEARERSGSLITADMALDQGRDVYALPGPVTSELSRGCHQLIKQGAGILLSPEDLLRDTGGWVNESEAFIGKNSMKNKIMLETTENLVYSKLDLYPKSKEKILEETGLGAAEVMKVLIALELKGYIHEISKNYYVRHK